jgi:hypothetical protein
MLFSNKISQLILTMLMLCAVIFAQSGRKTANGSRGASSGSSARRSVTTEPTAEVIETPAPTATPAPDKPLPPANYSSPKPVAVKNSWQGLTPLRSTTADVARLFGEAADTPDSSLVGPYRVEDGEVTFSYLTPSLAKLYRAPASMANKVFTIYLKPAATLFRSELKFNRSFKVCEERDANGYYYLVSDTGIAYQIKRSTEQVETIIFQPSRVEVRRLSVNTECVF